MAILGMRLDELFEKKKVEKVMRVGCSTYMKIDMDECMPLKRLPWAMTKMPPQSHISTPRQCIE
jgi:hypothetical protein